MTKSILAALVATVSIASLAPFEATAQERSLRKPSEKHTGARFYGRAHSVDHRGLCKRDTGTASGSLDFRNKCDTEEYWNRVLNGSGRR